MVQNPRHHPANTAHQYHTDGKVPMVVLSNVGMRYGTGDEVLHDIDMTLASGSFHYLTGRSGAGKSSLLRLLTLSHRPSRGLISLFGRDSSQLTSPELPAIRRQIGIVFQDLGLLDHLTTCQNVALPLKVARKYDHDQIDRHVRELLTWVGLGKKLDASPATLSGGEKQRAAIARAVIARPKLLLADEPTGNVDTQMGEKLMRLILEMNRQGTTVLLATHDSDLPARFPNPVLHLSGGTLSTASDAGTAAAMPGGGA